MKVGIVVPYSWSFWGGVLEHATTRRGRSAARPRRRSSWVTTRRALTGLLHPQADGTAAARNVIPVGRSVIVPANASLPNIILSPQSMMRMRRIWEREQFDVVHVHEPYADPLVVRARDGALPDRRHLPLGG